MTVGVYHGLAGETDLSFKTLLVHVEPDPAPDARLTLAVDLANQFDAKLVGVGAEVYRTIGLGGGYGYGAEFASAELLTTLVGNVEAI